MRNYGAGASWVPATVLQRLGSVNYRCELTSGGIVHRHADQIMKRVFPVSQPLAEKFEETLVPEPEVSVSVNVPECVEQPGVQSLPDAEEVAAPTTATAPMAVTSSPSLRHWTRRVKAPERLDL